MANENLTPEQQVQAAKEAELKSYLKEKYGIDEDPDTFKQRQQELRSAAEALPRYHATLEGLIRAAQEEESKAARQAVDRAPDPADDDAQMGRVFQADPYEGTKRVVKRTEQAFEERLNQVKEEVAAAAEANLDRREAARAAFGQVQAWWPEAFDRNSEIHKLGRYIYQNEMSDVEKANPRVFLIATERAAGRLGLPPKGRRQEVNPREDADLQNISRQSRRPRGSDGDDEKLTAKQKRIAEVMGIDEKVFSKVAKARREGRNLNE